jgi:hypothetical protein
MCHLNRILTLLGKIKEANDLSTDNVLNIKQIIVLINFIFTVRFCLIWYFLAVQEEWRQKFSSRPTTGAVHFLHFSETQAVGIIVSRCRKAHYAAASACRRWRPCGKLFH